MERWLPITGYEGLYEVSDLGRVRSITRAVVTGRGPRVYQGRILKQYTGPGTHGYPTVGLSRDGDERNVPVHTLVLTEFAGPRPPGQEALHGPGGKADPSLANLSWGTRAQNIADRVRDGQSNRGERNGRVKLSWEIVREIRRQAADIGPPYRRREIGLLEERLAAQYGVSQAAISLIILGRTWRDSE